MSETHLSVTEGWPNFRYIYVDPEKQRVVALKGALNPTSRGLFTVEVDYVPFKGSSDDHSQTAVERPIEQPHIWASEAAALLAHLPDRQPNENFHRLLETMIANNLL